MEALFSAICDRIGLEEGRLFAFHNAVIDDVFRLPLTREQYMARWARGEQRFSGKNSVRLGGGGMNFALCAASLGFRGASFVGVMDAEAFALAEKIKAENGIRLPLLWTETGRRRNTIIELDDSNKLFHDHGGGGSDSILVLAKLAMLRPGPRDWVASCSFYEEITLPLLEAGAKIFLDSGYGYPRREKMLASALCAKLRTSPVPELIIAANETELDNLADEFGAVGDGPVRKAIMISAEMSRRSGQDVRVLLHSESFSTLAGPGDPWAMPAFDVPVVRRTNAGDTFAGAFMAAYAATGDAALSCFFANAAAGKRISTDELPGRENMLEFLRKARLREPRADAPALKPRELALSIASSACRRASPVAGAPAQQTAR